MKKPTLVIMAAGIGSRFGGLKQIAPVAEQGHIIIDFSLFDAWGAGFRDLVFIIKSEMEETFREDLDYVKQAIRQMKNDGTYEEDLWK